MTKRQRRTCSADFKHDAASMVLDQGYRFAEACRAVDVHENTLRNWVQQLENEVSFEQGNEWIELGGSRVELI